VAPKKRVPQRVGGGPWTLRKVKRTEKRSGTGIWTKSLGQGKSLFYRSTVHKSGKQAAFRRGPRQKAGVRGEIG